MHQPGTGNGGAASMPPATLPELPVSPYTNLVTARGLAQLHARRADAQQRLDALESGEEIERGYLQRHLRWLQARIDLAVPVGPRMESRDRAGFGARVEVRDAEGHHDSFQIVGEDEADLEHGLLSWVAPLARALEGARVGERVRWRRADDEAEVDVLRVDYDDEPGARH
jgi:transcription elongation factor GreB